MKRLAACLVLALLLALTAQAAPASAPGASASRGARVVDINHFKYHPHTLSIPVGTKVVFSNSSGFTHTATSPGAFDTHRIKPGHSVAVRFGQKGTFAYHCKIHHFMHGKIVVG